MSGCSVVDWGTELHSAHLEFLFDFPLVKSRKNQHKLVIISRTGPGQQQCSCKSGSVMVSTSLSTSGLGSLSPLPQLQQWPPAPPCPRPPHWLSMCSFLHIGIIGRQGPKPMTEYFRDLWEPNFDYFYTMGCCVVGASHRCWPQADGHRPIGKKKVRGQNVGKSRWNGEDLNTNNSLSQRWRKPLVKLRFKLMRKRTYWLNLKRLVSWTFLLSSHLTRLKDKNTFMQLQ